MNEKANELENISPTKSSIKELVREQWLPLTDAFFEAKGYRPALNTVLRYIISGLHGERLSAERHSNRWVTTTDRVDDFINRSTNAKIELMQHPKMSMPLGRSEKSRARAIARAERELDKDD